MKFVKYEMNGSFEIQYRFVNFILHFRKGCFHLAPGIAIITAGDVIGEENQRKKNFDGKANSIIVKKR